MFKGLKGKFFITVIVLVVIAAAIILVPLLTKPAYATSTMLSILGGTDIQVLKGEESEAEWEQAEDGMVLKAGYTVKTGNDSYALITFFDGSTIEIDPDSELLIERMERDGDTATIGLYQRVGRTWHRVEKLLDPSSRYQVKTPAAVGAVRGTLVDIEVDETDTATFKTFEGTVDVQNDEGWETVGAGMQTSVDPGKAPAGSSPIPPAASRLEFSLESAAYMRVVDPLERSVGLVSPGIVVNQIPRATGSGALTEPQLVTIPDPIAGDYVIVLEGKEEGPWTLTVKGWGSAEYEPDPKSGIIGTGDDGETKNYQCKLTVVLDENGLLAAGTSLGEIEELVGDGPGKVVKQQTAAEKAEAGEPVAPEANFNMEISSDGETVLFINLSTGDISSYAWDFDSDGTVDSTAVNPSHSYTSTGIYTISLTVTGPATATAPAATDTKVREIYVVSI